MHEERNIESRTESQKTSGQSIDHFSYQLGVMDCFCEMVASGLKTLAMSHPCDTKEERDSYLNEVEKLCGKYQILFYPEDEAFLTDLFPAEMNRNKYNYLFFRTQDVLSRYLGLKERQKNLIESNQYTGSGRRELAADFGRLLSYPEDGIQRLIEKTKKERESLSSL